MIRVCFQKAKIMLAGKSASILSDPRIYNEYFRRLYGDLDLDEMKIQTHRQALDYPKVAELYRLISDITLPVVVRHGPYERHLKAWQSHPSRTTWGRLQPFVVNVFEYEARGYLQAGIIEDLGNGLHLWMERPVEPL